MIDRLQTRALLFCLLAAGISVTALVLSGMLQSLQRPGAVAAGVTLDLVLLIPVSYYLLVVRPRGWPPVALAPVIVLSLLAAAAILPSGYQQTLRVLDAVAIPVELGLLGWIGWQGTRALRHIRSDAPDDPVEALHQSARGLLRTERVADVLASELAVFFYAFGAWWSRPHTPQNFRRFTSHRRSGHGGLVFGLCVFTAAEGVVVHLLLARWSTTLAWIVSLLGVYGAMWLLADFRATVLRPTLASGGERFVRAGLRWRARILRNHIARVSRKRIDPDGRAISLGFLAAPNLWIQLSEPVLLHGPYGLRREAWCLGVFVDEPDDLARVLSHGAV